MEYVSEQPKRGEMLTSCVWSVYVYPLTGTALDWEPKRTLVFSFQDS